LFKAVSLQLLINKILITNKNIKQYLKTQRIGSSIKPVCFAPYTAMHFSFNGKVYACHNNNNHPYGDLQEKSLLKIWNGTNRQWMIKQLNKLKMREAGCTQCLHDIKKENYHSVSALRYEAYQEHSGNKYPSVLGFRFSDMCNIQCRMCLSNQHTRKCKQTQDSVYTDAFFEELKAFIPHARYAYFLGGEPFFEKHNFTVFDLFKELNPLCRISVQTNGTILTTEIKDLLSQGKYDINVSIDSMEPDMFAAIRKGAKLEIVLRNIEQFRAICQQNQTEFSSCFTPMIDNCLELPSIIDYYSHKLHSKIWINKYYFPAQYAIWALAPAKIDEIYHKLLAYQPEIKDEVSKYNALQFSDFLKLLQSYKNESKARANTNIDFKAEISKQLQSIKKEIKTVAHYNYIEIAPKLEVFNETPHKQTYYYLKKLLEIFSGDKLAENVLVLDKEFISNDVINIE
jgi:radical SAM protein with 4Fe4S-binding SPASM domain